MRTTFVRLSALVIVLALAIPMSPASAGRQSGLTPIVVFPAFHFTRLEVIVHDQRVDSACPRSGTFQDWFLNDQVSNFNQVCRDELMTLRVSTHHRLTFRNQPGVRVRIVDYGKTSSAPFYEPVYEALEAAGYIRDRNVVVAGYDSRLTPDLGGFLVRTKRLIERTSLANGNRPVHLVGHSNGPIYAEYLLTHTSAAWKAKYIQGFTPIAGNFPGQGLVYALAFTGLNITDFGFPATVENAESSARMYLSAPSTYLSSADPDVFGDSEVVISDASTARSYTPTDYRSLLADAGQDWAIPIADRYIGFLHMESPRSYPNVDVYAEKGSGLETVVGLGLPDLTVGQLLTDETGFYVRDGDVNQEDITNDAVAAWAGMSCFRFSLTDNPGIDHFSLPGDPGVLARLIEHANSPRSRC